jgi:DNA (cytosine-5)-methyltransferase 1
LTRGSKRRKLSVMSKRTVISLYTGAGGLDLGFEAAGFRTSLAVEFEPVAVRTLRANRDWPVLDRDIHKISSKEILRTANLRSGDADILIGGPPCQPFSKSGYWATGDTLRLEDPRAGTIGAYFRVLRDTLPRAFLLENVAGLAYRSKSEGFDFISRVLRRINRQTGSSYQLSVALLNCAEFGVPQLRERVFVVGVRDGSEFIFPNPTHSLEASRTGFGGLAPALTAWDAIGDLQDDRSTELSTKGRWAALLQSIPEGRNYLWHTARGGGLPLFGWRRRYWTFLLKLSKALPSWTLQAQPGPAVGPFHWKNRRLSMRELCRLQTIPDSYRLEGSLSDAQRQVGNAVPSAMAEVLARTIRKQIFGDRLRAHSALIPKYRGAIPEPEPIGAVPSIYSELVGNHEPHPGTGRGYAAERRRIEGERQASLALE